MARSHRTVPVMYLLPFLFVALFTIHLGLSLADLPSLKLMQDIICKHHFSVTSDELLPEAGCRVEPVQRELNIVNVGMLISSTIEGALVALPFGMLSDRIGRVPVLALSLLSMLLAQGYTTAVLWQWKKLPLRAIWGAAGALLFGGGRSVAEAMVFTIISDVAPGRNQATWFQWVAGAVLSPQLFGPLLAGRLIKDFSVWAPLCVSLVLMLLGGSLLAFYTPETVSKNLKPEEARKDTTVPASSRKTIKSLFTRPAVFLLPGAVLSIPVATLQSNVLLRLMPIQFDWPLDRSVLLVSLRSLATLVTLLIILPGASYLCHKTSAMPPLRRDRILARASAILFTFGSLCLLMITNEALIITGLIVSALGSGIPTLCRAMLVAIVGEHRTGSMFGVLAVGEVLGFLVCELGMGWLFDVGLGVWIGLPFCFGLVLALGIGLVTWMAWVPEKAKTPEILIDPLADMPTLYRCRH